MLSDDHSSSLSGQTILCLATQEWDAHWTPVQQVMLRLAPRNRVLYFEPFHGMFAWMRNRNHLLRKQRAQSVPQLREVHRNLFVYRPEYPYVPGNMRLPFAHSVNSQLYKRETQSFLKRMGAQRPWLWAYFAQSLSILDLPFERFIYDCIDDWVSFFTQPAERAFVTRVDTELCRRADVLFVGSEPLRAKKCSLNPNIHIVNHGADIAHFAQATAPETVTALDLESIPQPRIGFVGMVDPLRFDMELIAKIAEHPEYHVAIVGGFMGDARAMLPEKSNIHVLGMKSVSELPRYLKGMDVCIMPYRVNETTKYIFPLKLFEYMATGKPIVTTSIPAVQSFSEVMYVSNGPEDFMTNLARALSECDRNITSKRLALAWEYDWMAHVRRKEAILTDTSAAVARVS